MSFQIDYIQADAFQSLISDSPFTIPMSRKRIGARIEAAGLVHRYYALATGELSIFDAILTSPNAGSTAVIFNVRLDGVAIWTGGDRPSIAPGETRVQKTNIGELVTRAITLVEIWIDQVPWIGVPTPITTILDVVVGAD